MVSEAEAWLNSVLEAVCKMRLVFTHPCFQSPYNPHEMTNDRGPQFFRFRSHHSICGSTAERARMDAGRIVGLNEPVANAHVG